MIYIKRGVVLANLQQENLLEPAYVADQLFHLRGWGHVHITSGIEGNHMKRSYHYGAGRAMRGQATDVRGPRRGRSLPAITEAVAILKKKLPRWRVILERGEKNGVKYYWIHFQPLKRT